MLEFHELQVCWRRLCVASSDNRTAADTAVHYPVVSLHIVLRKKVLMFSLIHQAIITLEVRNDLVFDQIHSCSMINFAINASLYNDTPVVSEMGEEFVCNSW